MSVPTEVVADGKAEILTTVNSFNGVTMEPVYGVFIVSFVCADVNDLTFSGLNFICHFLSHSSKARISFWTDSAKYLAKYLGVTLTQDLKWYTHIQNICAKANQTIDFQEEI